MSNGFRNPKTIQEVRETISINPEGVPSLSNRDFSRINNLPNSWSDLMSPWGYKSGEKPEWRNKRKESRKFKKEEEKISRVRADDDFTEDLRGECVRSYSCDSFVYNDTLFDFENRQIYSAAIGNRNQKNNIDSFDPGSKEDIQYIDNLAKNGNFDEIENYIYKN